MKKLLLTLFLIGTVGVTQAQTFNGIEVGQSFAKTKEQLQAKGYVEVSSSDPVIKEYRGTVNGLSCKIIVVLTPTSKLVWKLVFQSFPVESWSSAESEYEKYKSIIAAKYGEPKNHFEFFSSPYKKGDGYELQALSRDKCTYRSYFKDSSDNNVAVELKSLNYGEAAIWISYENKEGVAKYKSEKSAIDKETF
jgi:hypothetical protein